MKLKTYFLMKGNAREAIEFYSDVFESKDYQIMTYGESPDPQMPYLRNQKTWLCAQL